VGSEVAIPVLDYDAMVPENNFQTSYYLEKDSVHNVLPYSRDLVWTKKIPLEIKNLHREFWGMKPLKEKQ
jgi:hypothetical protein